MGAPYFKKATITLENGKKLEISAPKNNDDNRYIRSLNYNGKNYTKNYLNHFDLLKGGRLVFDMDNKPNREEVSTNQTSRIHSLVTQSKWIWIIEKKD